MVVSELERSEVKFVFGFVFSMKETMERLRKEEGVALNERVEEEGDGLREREFNSISSSYYF